MSTGIQPVSSKGGIHGNVSSAAFALALSMVDGMGSRTALKVLSVFHMEYSEAWLAPRSAWEALGLKEETITSWEALRDRLSTASDLEALLVPYQACGIQVLPLGDPQYPYRLLEIYDPPLVLFVRGPVDVLSNPNSLAVVGTRHMSDYGQRVTAKLVGELGESKGCIVSGLAQGIDATAHRAALHHKLPTVAVFGCGIDVVYPRTNRRLADEILESGGAWVSEYPLGVQPVAHQFPRRNRIVAGLAQGVLVIEGSLKSGSLITARLALDENRSVMTIPHNLYHPDSEGPHELLRQGAVLVTEGRHIIEELGWDLLKKPAGVHRSQKKPKGTAQLENPSASEATTDLPEVSLPSVGPPERHPLLSFIPLDPVSLEGVLQQSGLTPQGFQQALTLLELEGAIALLPGQRVVRVP